MNSDELNQIGSSQRAWQRMLSGRKLDLLNPHVKDIEITDIAHGLARVARWNGQTVGDHALSVAQHALIVEDITLDMNPNWPSKWRRAALLHDAAEYVIGDLISPFKTAIGLDYKAFELKLLGAIHQRFDVPVVLPENIARKIKKADHIAAYFEATVLAGFDRAEALTFFGAPLDISKELASRLENLHPVPASIAQNSFLIRFRAIS